jgi:hypothetical protein
MSAPILMAALIVAAQFRLAPNVDSVRLARSARNAQSSFESFRRNRLPLSQSNGGGYCDVRIGRYCYWRGDEDDDDK